MQNGHTNGTQTHAPSSSPTSIMIYAGGPCTCVPGRYIRFIDPPGVPGLEPKIACRGVDSPNEDKRYHAIPEHAVLGIRLPVLWTHQP